MVEEDFVEDFEVVIFKTVDDDFEVDLMVDFLGVVVVDFLWEDVDLIVDFLGVDVDLMVDFLGVDVALMVDFLWVDVDFNVVVFFVDDLTIV